MVEIYKIRKKLTAIWMQRIILKVYNTETRPQVNVLMLQRNQLHMVISTGKKAIEQKWISQMVKVRTKLLCRIGY